MVVGTPDAGDLGVWGGGQAVAEGHLPELRGADGLGYLAGEQVLAVGARAVYELPEPEEDEPPLDAAPVERPAEVVDRVGQGVDDASLAQVVHEPVDVTPPGLGLRVNLRVEAVDEDVYAGPVFRKAGGDLLADKEVRVVDEGQGPFYRLVVGQGDEVHTGAFGRPVGLFRGRVGLADTHPIPEALHPDVRGRPRRPRVQVQVDPRPVFSLCSHHLASQLEMVFLRPNPRRGRHRGRSARCNLVARRGHTARRAGR